MSELADDGDLKSPGAIRVGSSPTIRTIWASSESANAVDCKSISFGSSWGGTNLAHHYADVVERQTRNTQNVLLRRESSNLSICTIMAP